MKELDMFYVDVVRETGTRTYEFETEAQAKVFADAVRPAVGVKGAYIWS